MKEKMLQHAIRRPECRTLALCAALALLAPAGWVADATAQEDPTTIGAGQKPFVVIVVDTSGSMEYGSDPSDIYAFPRYRGRDGSTSPPGVGPNASQEAWRPGVLFGNSADRTREQYEDRDYENSSVGPTFVGPCYVWKDQCSSYKRPPWFPEFLKPGYGASAEYSGAMRGRLLDMRGRFDPGTGSYTGDPLRDGIRLRDNDQPRHVQLKEILTGDMILRPRQPSGSDLVSGQLDPQVHGPGCWIVPRMSGVGINSDVSHMCRNPDNSTSTTWFAGGNNSFQQFPDIRDTRPHLQEVFDDQLPTGLLDRMSNTAIFAVAMLDGFNQTEQTHPGPYNAPGDRAGRRFNDGIPDGAVEGETPEASSSTFDLGVYKIVAPIRLDVPTSLLSGFSTYAQYALVDAGFQRNYTAGDQRLPSTDPRDSSYWAVDPVLGENSPAEYPFPTKLERYVLPYYLGQQPIAKATPLAAAIRDIHTYMRNGQREFRYDGNPVGAATLYTPPADPIGDDSHRDVRNPGQNYIVNPVDTDRYRECRPKHVVLMTDGYPDPERPGGPVDLGTRSLVRGGAYGYEGWDTQNRYVYERAENEIRSFVDDTRLNDVYSGGPDRGDKFKPRVHVVSLNIEQDDTGTTSTLETVEANLEDVALKMGLMAKEGRTCVQHALLQGAEGQRYVPVTMGGTCVPGVQSPASSGNCLIQQLVPGSYSFPIPIPSVATGPQIDCVAPALMLQNDDRGSDTFAGPDTSGTRDDMSRVLQLVLNEVLDSSGGVASRTRATVASTLDDTDKRGQYRVFSGVQVSGGSTYWKGILERETLVCGNASAIDDSATVVRSLDQDIDLQVRPVAGSPGEYQDNRRIFTTVADLNGPSKQLRVTSNNRYFSYYPLRRSGPTTDDEFKVSEFTGSSNAAFSRIPFFVPSIRAAIDGGVHSTDASRYNDMFSVDTEERAENVVREVRGHLVEKENRILGGILNSNPVTVGPPSEDVAIDSYRSFKLKYANRATMLYVSTLDGLLHAIHTGRHDGAPYGVRRRQFNQVDRSTSTPVVDGNESQREAWAYMPEIIRRKVDASRNANPNLMDGTPIVSDVRLCYKSSALNQNEQACRAAQNGLGEVEGVDQWRTVLIQGLGQAGSGYFAMDVTRPGGRTADGSAVTLPDPTLLWEFDPYWELRQLNAVSPALRRARFGYGSNSPANASSAPSSCPSNPTSAADLIDMPFMGISIGRAEIGTVVVDDVNNTTQRAVAIFGAGQNGDTSGPTNCLASERRGRAIYVVDLQTGTMLRRFVTYEDSGTHYRFQSEITGTPVLSDSRPGVVSNRGFFGDAAGRLFRMNLSSTNPDDWSVDLFFDPCSDTSLVAQVGGTCTPLTTQDLGHPSVNRPFGPAMFKPAVALTPQRELAVVYGLGEKTDVSASTDVQAMFALVERFNSSGDPVADTLWSTSFPENVADDFTEKVTGEPIIFNFGVYFTTFVESKSDPCIPGQSRIWGLRLLGSPTVPGEIEGVIELEAGQYTTMDLEVSGGNPAAGGLFKWYGPVEPVLIRGLALTRRPSCNFDLGTGNINAAVENEEPGVDLIATTGATPVAGDAYSNSQSGGGNSLYGGAAGELNYSVKRLENPKSTLEPLSWSFIGQ